ncbi:GDSL esterase/lipase 7-like [Hibiscus syriacus]|uniref:GDSL esterase/lipase 7-like n=1 Tax=Hibiscus syriacus TaxID=106335 RepID=UPI0019247CD9|nr:GDSL esterase/lipase 7-like [Hibiscus syriacus]
MKVMKCILNLFLFFKVVSLGFADVVPVPSFEISKESILKHLSLDNITLDLPALYVFGDNFVDAGNNNYLNLPRIQSNYSPYGIDFDGKPTGRYTNGRTVADFIAQFTGLPFPPPVLSLSKDAKRVPQTGLNYATGFTGICRLYDKPFEPMPALKEQVELFEQTTIKLRSQFGSEESFSKYMSGSLFFINTISFDLDHAWYGLGYLYHDYYHHQLIIKDLSEHLQRLYQLGARKIVVNNAFPLGCQPNLNLRDNCNEVPNERAMLFNQMLSNLTKDLQSTLPKSQFVLVDLYKIFEDVFKSPASYVERCVENVEPCKDRSSNVFFDGFNPTESMHFIWARRLLKDSSTQFSPLKEQLPPLLLLLVPAGGEQHRHLHQSKSLVKLVLNRFFRTDPVIENDLLDSGFTEMKSMIARFLISEHWITELIIYLNSELLLLLVTV